VSAPGQPPVPPSPGQTLGAMWLYTVLRFGLFLALWGLLWVARVPGFLAAVIALALSIPLSYILLRKQRAKLAANLEARVTARQTHRHTLDAQLAGEDADTTERRPARPKRRGGSAEQ
jgi:UPF0716 family protein affecting phage T7 exclusion